MFGRLLYRGCKWRYKEQANKYELAEQYLKTTNTTLPARCFFRMQHVRNNGVMHAVNATCGEEEIVLLTDEKTGEKAGVCRSTKNFPLEADKYFCSRSLSGGNDCEKAYRRLAQKYDQREMACAW